MTAFSYMTESFANNPNLVIQLCKHAHSPVNMLTSLVDCPLWEIDWECGMFDFEESNSPVTQMQC